MRTVLRVIKVGEKYFYQKKVKEREISNDIYIYIYRYIYIDIYI